MSNTKIKAGQFSGIVGNGTDGYFLMTNGDGTMAWEPAATPSPTVISVTYPGDDTAADPAGGQSVTLTGTNFATGATVTIGGTTAPTVSFVSATELTITTPAKAAGDYDIVVTNTDGGTATFVDGISYNGIPAWTTASGSLGTFASDTTISTITLQASEPDAGTITFNITSGALPTGLSLTGADIDGTTSKETADTLYNFTVTAIDDENQSTPRAFSITVEKYIVPAPENFEIVTYTGNGGTQAITSKIGKAASFNGSSSKIYNTNINVSDSFSMSIWFNTARIDSGNQQIFTLGWDEGGADRVSVGIDTDNPSNLSIYASNSGGWLGISNSISVNTWHHLVIAYDNTVPETKCYLDGSLAYTDTRAITNNSSVKTLALSTFGIDGGNATAGYFEGKLDQFRLFNKALSSSEVTTLYNETYASSTKSTTDIFGDGSGIALYELDEDANSSNFGQAAVFNGSSSKIAINSLSLTETSVSLWVNMSNLSKENYVFSFNYNASNGFVLFFLNNQFFFIDNAGTGDVVTLSSTSAITQNQWHHLVLIITSTTTTLYIDGSAETPASNNRGTTTFPMPFELGYATTRNKTTAYYVGKIDQVRIYDTALSSGDVTNLYNESSVPTTNLVAHYKLDGNAEDVLDTYDGTETSITYSTGVYGGTPTDVNFLGMAFQPDLVWIKPRSANYGNIIYDSVRGTNKRLFTYTNIQEFDDSPYALTSFDTNGFTVSDIANGDYGVNGPTGGLYSGSDAAYVAWCWKAGGAAVSNTDGSITSTVSANTDAGFSIVDWDATTTVSDTIGHGLDNKPELVIMKNRSRSSNWFVFTDIIDGSYDFLYLNETNSKADSTRNVPTADVFDQGNLGGVVAGDNCIAYCFHSVDGYQKVGSYTGTSSSVTVSGLGFQPRFLLIKGATAGASFGGSWLIVDNVRGDGGFSTAKFLRPDTNGTEFTNAVYGVTFTSDGFIIPSGSSVNLNTDGGGFIYLAIA